MTVAVPVAPLQAVAVVLFWRVMAIGSSMVTDCKAEQLFASVTITE